MQSKPNSTYYNRPDIEYKALKRNNNILLGVGPKMALPSIVGQYPTSRTTGNGLIYLTGNLIVNAPLVAGDIIAILPPSRPPLVIGNYTTSSAADPVVTLVIVNIDGTSIKATDSILAGETIYLDGIVYLQDFPVE